MVVQRIGVLSLGKVFAAIYGVMGLLLGGVFFLVTLAGVAVGGANADPVAPVMGLGMVILFPILYGSFAFIGGIITAALYNLVAGLIGGVEVDLAPGVNEGGHRMP